MVTCNVKDNLCLVWAKIVGFMDNKPWWEIENGERLVNYDDNRYYHVELSAPLIPR